MKIVLIRHGQSMGNLNCSVYREIPQAEIELSEKGIQQCCLLSSILCKKEIINNNTIVIHSPLKRAKQTSEILVKQSGFNIALLSDPLLVEQWWGEANGYSSFDEYINNLPGEKELYKSTGFFYYRPPRGESLADVYQRVGMFLVLKRFFRDDFFQNILLVAHSSVVQMLEKHMIGCEANPKFVTDPNNVWGNCHAKIYTIRGWDYCGPQVEKVECVDPE